MRDGTYNSAGPFGRIARLRETKVKKNNNNIGGGSHVKNARADKD